MSLTHLSDAKLIEGLRDNVVEEKRGLVAQLDFLVELQRRKLYYQYSSLWSLLVREFRMEEWTAERRIRAAKLMARIPAVSAVLRSGRVTISVLEIAQACANQQKLSDEELTQLLDSLCELSCSAARKEVARRYPVATPDLPYDRIRPLTEDLSEVRFVASDEVLAQLEEVKGLLAHSHPGISMGELVGVLATDYLKRHHPEQRAERAVRRAERRAERRGASVTTPATMPAMKLVEKRGVPQFIVHALIRLKGYRCGHVDPLTQKRCSSRHGLEIHHLHAWSKGGLTELKNLEFRCLSHHQRASFLEFGPSPAAALSTIKISYAD